MKTFKDLKFEVQNNRSVGTRMDFDNGFSISVIAGFLAYSLPRKNNTNPNFFKQFEIAVFSPDGDFTREFFPQDHHDDVLGWQDRDEITDLMLRIQQHNLDISN